ncbi:alpha-amylase [Schizopora paradoxa]|uniref:alpha-amylase n=1 Tax=Schizopora paradoxa TaxID=27342 RepID=A0A0H2S547_9AGAM|nr:alpha-amylase [Schizopora paradoxa]
MTGVPSFLLVSICSALLLVAQLSRAATADQWRGRSIYQLIVDRYALPQGADLDACDPGQQTWCGGTWKTVMDNLDYIQNAGFTAIWISPVSQNYQGPRTPYGDPYHGYWIADATQLNDKFGTADDLKALSDEIHRRGMYLMVDVVVNNVMALTTDPDLSTFLFKDKSLYHPYCPVDYSNLTSEQQCWLGDLNVTLPDVKTEDPTVISTYGNWIQSLVQQFNIDGLRIDEPIHYFRHVDMPFWPAFCGSAGVFCMGEVFEGGAADVGPWQGNQSMDSVLNYPMYTALTEALTIPGPQNMTAVADMIAQSKQYFTDPTVLGNFIENQDVPRWLNMSVDPQSLYNAMVFNFMSDGIPIVYYGQEQGAHGASDPYNREPLWPSGYANTTTYQLVTKLNTFRNFLVNTTDWATTPMQVLTSSPNATAILKGKIVSVVTNIGSPPANLSVPVYTPWKQSDILTEIISCDQYSVGSNGTIQMQYSKGGEAAVFINNDDIQGAGVCGYAGVVGSTGSTISKAANGAAASVSVSRFSTVLFGLALAFVFFFVSF